MFTPSFQKFTYLNSEMNLNSAKTFLHFESLISEFQNLIPYFLKYR